VLSRAAERRRDIRGQVNRSTCVIESVAHASGRSCTLHVDAGILDLSPNLNEAQAQCKFMRSFDPETGILRLTKPTSGRGAKGGVLTRQRDGHVAVTLLHHTFFDYGSREGKLYVVEQTPSGVQCFLGAELRREGGLLASKDVLNPDWLRGAVKWMREWTREWTVKP